MLDPWTFNTLQKGQEKNSKLVYLITTALEFGNKIVLSIRYKFKSKDENSNKIR